MSLEDKNSVLSNGYTFHGVITTQQLVMDERDSPT